MYENWGGGGNMTQVPENPLYCKSIPVQKKTKSHQLFHGEFGSSFTLKKNLSGRISTSQALLKYVINRRKITKEGVFWRVKNGAGMIR